MKVGSFDRIREKADMEIIQINANMYLQNG